MCAKAQIGVLAHLAEFAAVTPAPAASDTITWDNDFRNGMLLIEKNGKIYNVQGQMVNDK
ncbi:MAG: hypothetical protein IJ814_08975 [Paludibacteraceae bacterium]|nr:hypothetical protein [Paludibacteraceae bacterium]